MTQLHAECDAQCMGCTELGFLDRATEQPAVLADADGSLPCKPFAPAGRAAGLL